MFLDVVAKYKVSNFFGAPAYMILTKHPRLKSADLSSMKNIIIGGADFPIIINKKSNATYQTLTSKSLMVSLS
jgi:acyl-coenzyme A synthetase/AMP-(fatty) acid ligase